MSLRKIKDSFVFVYTQKQKQNENERKRKMSKVKREWASDAFVLIRQVVRSGKSVQAGAREKSFN